MFNVMKQNSFQACRCRIVVNDDICPQVPRLEGRSVRTRLISYSDPAFRLDKEFLKEYMRTSGQFTVARDRAGTSQDTVAIKIRPEHLLEFFVKHRKAELLQNTGHHEVDRLPISRIT